MQLLLIWLLSLCALVVARVPLRNPNARHAVKDSYIVVFTPDLPKRLQNKLENNAHSEARRNRKMKGITVKYAIPGLNGFAIEIDEAGLEKLQNFPYVEYIEKDISITVGAVAAPVEEVSDPVEELSERSHPRALLTQTSSAWGLGRISHRNAGSSSYIYDSSAGTGTRVYVLDTGIYTAHSEFGSRAVWGSNLVSGSANTDENGHGTHVAGIIGGTTYGVAKSTTLVAVKVLNARGTGTASDTLAGIQWAINNATALKAQSKSVISMAYGGGLSSSINNAVQAATQAGLTVVTAAGNGDSTGVATDAGQISPASAQSAITVTATDINDNKPLWANYGTVVDLFAPGDSIPSAWIGNTRAVATMSGTSMSSAHVAGLASYLIAQLGLPSPPVVMAAVLGMATQNKVKNPNNVPNRLAYNGNGA